MKTAPWIKDLPHKCEDWSSDLQNPGKSQAGMVAACNSNTWWVGMGSPQQAGELDSLNQGSSGFSKRLAPENEAESDQVRHLMSNMHVHMCTHLGVETPTPQPHICTGSELIKKRNV